MPASLSHLAARSNNQYHKNSEKVGIKNYEKSLFTNTDCSLVLLAYNRIADMYGFAGTYMRLL